MKLSAVAILLLAGTTSVSAFTTTTAPPPIAFVKSVGVDSSSSSRRHGNYVVALEASRAAQKKASRMRWIESRGGGGVEELETTTAEAGQFTSEEGLDYIRLVHPDTGSTSDIYLYGGVVTSYVHEGIEYIAVRPDAKLDGSKPISGGLSHCWPQFGPGEIQQHGFARNVNWDVVSVSDTSVELALTPSDYTKEMWDKPFKCSFTVALEADKLSTSMKVDNEGDESSFDFQAALHSYFTVSALENLEIRGSFEGKEFLNKLAGDNGELQTESRSVLTIDEEYDRVYTGVNDPVLADKGTGKTLTVENSAGYEDTVVWNPFGDEGMGYNNFVCVESVKFDPVTLGSGETWLGDMSLIPGNME